ncbi:CocE/NonD family hydrolase [Mycobacterium lentiflavum]|uniref:CocE/NonD family hydrolase n=1 Tax=Mycobacterium lentiflavum TaxID=141349 RepID=A0ABY3V2D1_MYCLN|nr:CocE/NonD family hydrolase [Mycobacterium lentiflavum]ULP43662.2 CocE/NonD family hydrolase [Mycobacterium lentiflavum]
MTTAISRRWGRTFGGGPPKQYRLISQVGRLRFSKLTSWESPDPDFWVGNGYAVVNLNLPGYGGSQGRPSAFGRDQAAAYFDAVEWVAEQPWCSGRIGLSGVSFLAISQYYVAACAARGGRAPEGLKAISPWEGLTDPARDVILPGGVKESGFPSFWWFMEIQPGLTGNAQDFLDVEGSPPLKWAADHPVIDDFWREKMPSLEGIEVPMLVCGSFSDHGMHTDGSFRAFQRASGPKWLYTHRTGKWTAYYSDEVKALLLQFFDSFVKGHGDNGFQSRAPVRLEVRSSRDVIHAVRDEQAWPLPATQWTTLYLDGGTYTLTAAAPAAHSIEQEAASGLCRFGHVFAEDTEITGPMTLNLDLELRAGDRGPAPTDAVIFAVVDKLDRHGRRVPFHGSVGNDDDSVTRGCICASARELDAECSTPWLPVVTLSRRSPVAVGERIRLSIALSPSSTFFAAGERLQLSVSGKAIAQAPPYHKDNSPNRGRHVLHLGGSEAAHLLVPRVP